MHTLPLVFVHAMTIDLGLASILAMDSLEQAQLESSLLESFLESSMAEVVPPPAAGVPLPPAPGGGDTLEGLRAEQRQNNAQRKALAKRVRPGLPSPRVSLPLLFFSSPLTGKKKRRRPKCSSTANNYPLKNSKNYWRANAQNALNSRELVTEISF